MEYNETHSAEQMIASAKKIPFDVICHILAYCDLVTLKVMSLANHEFGQEASRFIWRLFSINTEEGSAVQRVTRLEENLVFISHPRRAVHLRVLRIDSWIGSRDFAHREMTAIIAALEKMTQLVRLVLVISRQGCIQKPAQVLSSGGFAPQLRSLVCLHDLDVTWFEPSFWERHPALSVLEWDGIPGPTSNSSFRLPPSIRTVKLRLPSINIIEGSYIDDLTVKHMFMYNGDHLTAIHNITTLVNPLRRFEFHTGYIEPQYVDGFIVLTTVLSQVQYLCMDFHYHNAGGRVGNIEALVHALAPLKKLEELKMCGSGWRGADVEARLSDAERDFRGCCPSICTMLRQVTFTLDEQPEYRILRRGHCDETWKTEYTWTKDR